MTDDMTEATPEELAAIPAGVSGLVCTKCERKHYGLNCKGEAISPITGEDLTIRPSHLAQPATVITYEDDDDTNPYVSGMLSTILAAAKPPVVHLPVDPQTVEDYAKYVTFRAANVERWARTWAENPTVLCEQIARLEGDLAAMRILVKHAPRKSDRIDETLGRL
jgi:hypothetical protein